MYQKLKRKMTLKEILAVKRRALARRQKVSICFNSEVPPHPSVCTQNTHCHRQPGSLAPSTGDQSSSSSVLRV